MFRINNNAPLIIILILLIVLSVSKFLNLTVTIVLIIGAIALCNKYDIVHTRQLMIYFEKFVDFLLANDSPLEIREQIDNFQNILKSDVSKGDINVPKSVIYSKIPLLSEYEKLGEDLSKFIDEIKDNTLYGVLDRKRIKIEINKKIGFIFFNAYMVMSEPFYPDKNYYACLDSQRSLLNEIHGLIYLDLDPLHDDKMNELLDRTLKLNKRLNEYLINNIKGTNPAIDNGEEISVDFIYYIAFRHL